MPEKPKAIDLDPRLYLTESQRVYPVFKALASYERLEILNLLCARSMNVKEIAEAMRLPMSSASMHVRVLEEAGLLISVMQPGKRGNVKLCSKAVATFHFFLTPRGHDFRASQRTEVLDLPIGAFSEAVDIRPMCGMATLQEHAETYDIPSLFYLPQRLEAKIIWFRSGFLEYCFPLPDQTDARIQWLEVSFEGNPQTSSYHAPCKSDISVYLNDVRLGTWQSEADRSIRRGFLTPDYWPSEYTQYGELKTWRVTSGGSYLNSMSLSSVTLDQLSLDERDVIRVRIGIEADAKNCGGLVLFGEQAGDFAQGVVLRLGYGESR